MIDIADIMAHPRHFPHAIDFGSGALDFVETSPDRLRTAEFLDGRSDFSTGSGASLPLDRIDPDQGGAPLPDRFIFHTAFCGSTLLTRLLDVEGRALALREPKVLIDIASRWAALDKAGQRPDDLPRTLAVARSLLRRRWRDDEAIVIKPTNWINNILSDLFADPRSIRAIFLTMPRADFVRAVFRGGSDRIAFAARAAVHLSSRGAANADLVAQALARETDQMGILAGLAAVAHEVQIRLFREAIGMGAAGYVHCLTMHDILSPVMSRVSAAARALDLDISETDLERNRSIWLGRHAKQTGSAFSAEAEKASTADMMRAFGEVITQALQWAEDVLGPDQGIEVRSQPVIERRGPAA